MQVAVLPDTLKAAILSLLPPRDLWQARSRCTECHVGLWVDKMAEICKFWSLGWKFAHWQSRPVIS